MCTTMIITNGATADGSMMVTHSDDDELQKRAQGEAAVRRYLQGIDW